MANGAASDAVDILEQAFGKLRISGAPPSPPAPFTTPPALPPKSARLPGLPAELLNQILSMVSDIEDRVKLESLGVLRFDRSCRGEIALRS